jgi:hypothetical protein
MGDFEITVDRAFVEALGVQHILAVASQIIIPPVQTTQSEALFRRTPAGLTLSGLSGRMESPDGEVYLAVGDSDLSDSSDGGLSSLPSKEIKR